MAMTPKEMLKFFIDDKRSSEDALEYSKNKNDNYLISLNGSLIINSSLEAAMISSRMSFDNPKKYLEDCVASSKEIYSYVKSNNLERANKNRFMTLSVLSGLCFIF